MQSPDGHCRAVRRRAPTARCSAAARASCCSSASSDALADGDRIHAVMRGGAINNDGALKVGFTAPSVDGQAEVIAEALGRRRRRRRDASATSRRTAPATALGDPIEVAALTQAFAGRHRPHAVLRARLGEGATSATSTPPPASPGSSRRCSRCEHGQLPPTLHFARAEPEDRLRGQPVLRQRRSCASWPRDGRPAPRRRQLVRRRRHQRARRARGGAAARPRRASPRATSSCSSCRRSRRPRSTQLTDAAAPTTSRRVPALDLADVAYTLQVGRRAFRHRRTVVAGDRARRGERAAQAATRAGDHAVCDGRGAGPCVFCSRARARSTPAWARGLYEREPVFRDAIDAAARLLRRHLGARPARVAVRGRRVGARRPRRC